MISNQICNQLLTHCWLQGFCFHIEHLQGSTYPGVPLPEASSGAGPHAYYHLVDPLDFFPKPTAHRLFSASTGKLTSLLPAVSKVLRFFTTKNL